MISKQAIKLRATRQFGTATHRFLILRLSGLYIEPPCIVLTVNNRLQPSFFPFFGGKPVGADKRNMRPMRGGVGAGDSPRPYPGDDVGLASALFSGQGHFGVQVANLLKGLLADDIAIVAHVFCQTPCAGTADLAFYHVAAHVGIDGLLPQPTRHQLQIAFVQEHRHRVEVSGMGHKAQTRGFQRDGAAAGEGIEHVREFAASMSQHLRTRPGVDFRLVVQLFLHEVAHNTEQPLALGGLCFLGRKFLRMGRGIIHHRRE